MNFIKNSPIFKNKETLKNLGIYVFGSVFLRGISFFLIPIYIKVLSPAQYGQLDILNNILTVVSLILSFGFIPVLCIDYLQVDKKRKIDLIKTVISTYLVIGLSLWILLSIVIILFRSTLMLENIPPLIVSIVLIISFLTYFQTIYFAILQLRKEALKLTIIKVAFGLLMAAINLVLVYYYQFGILGIFISSLITLIITIFIGLYDYFQKINHPFIEFNFEKSKKIIQLGFPLVIGSIAYWSLSGVDRWIVLKNLGEKDLGIYSLSYRFSSLYEALLIGPLMSAYTPYIFEKFNKGYKRQKFTFIILGSVIFSVFLGFGIQFVASFIVNQKFIESLQYIPLLTIAFGFFFLSQLCASTITYFKKTKLLMYNLILASIINIISNFYFTTHLGLYGACYAYILSNFFWLIIVIYQVRKVENEYFSNLNINN